MVDRGLVLIGDTLPDAEPVEKPLKFKKMHPTQESVDMSWITNMSLAVETEHIETTTFSDTNHQYIPGKKCVRMRLEGRVSYIELANNAKWSAEWRAGILRLDGMIGDYEVHGDLIVTHTMISHSASMHEHVTIDGRLTDSFVLIAPDKTTLNGKALANLLPLETERALTL